MKLIHFGVIVSTLKITFVRPWATLTPP